MNITGPIQTNLPPIQEKPEQFLKVNQRIAGEILNISNEQVVLAVNGIQIVARMTSAEQLASLMEKRYAYFVVKEINQEQITLQIATPHANEEIKKPATDNLLGKAILEQFGIPSNDKNLQIVQALLNRGLQITSSLFIEINEVLKTNPEWSAREAQLAAAIKSAGLPLTEESLKIALNAAKDIRINFINLYEQLVASQNRPDLTPAIRQQIQSVLDTIKNIMVNGGDTSENIENVLRWAVKGLGTSIENEIAKLIKPANMDGQTDRINNLLFSLSHLNNQLSSSSTNQLARSIENFIEGMRWTHFLNVEPDQTISKGQWTQLDLPITFSSTNNNQQTEMVRNMKIRIAHESGSGNENKINPAYTRLVIQVDIDERQRIKVDLSIVSQMIGAEITGTNKEICACASEELDEFKTGLSNLGYTLKTSKIELGNAILEMDFDDNGASLTNVTSVDMGV